MARKYKLPSKLSQASRRRKSILRFLLYVVVHVSFHVSLYQIKSNPHLSPNVNQVSTHQASSLMPRRSKNRCLLTTNRSCVHSATTPVASLATMSKVILRPSREERLAVTSITSPIGVAC